MNTIHSESIEKALADLEEVKEEYEGTEIKLSEVGSIKNWSC